LEQIYEKADFHISIKTRIGKDNPDEFYQLLEIFNKYSITELTIHPRLQTDYYQNIPNREMYAYAEKGSKNPICYNGDLFTSKLIDEFKVQFPQTDAIMLGRGLIQNPGLIQKCVENKMVSKGTLYAFHQTILDDYISISSGDRNVLFKMKELWFYMISMFEQPEKFSKKIKKTERIRDYELIIKDLFDTCELRKDIG
jgi:tRNA-dihydrouridine synthase